MTMSKISRTCLTNTRDDINSTVRDLNARIDSHYYQAFGKKYSPPAAVSLPHGVPTLVTNPFAASITPLAALALNCDTQANPSLTVAATVVVSGVTVTAPSGQVYLTALYPLAEQFGSLVATAGQLLSGVGSTLITFPALSTTSIGANITYDGSSKLIAGKNGLYQVWYQATFQFNASGTRDAWISVNGSGDYGLQGVFTNTYSAEGTYLSGSDVLPLNAGDFIQLVQYANGQSVNINTSVVAAYAPRLRMRQLSNDASLTAKVTYSMLSS